MCLAMRREYHTVLSAVPRHHSANSASCDLQHPPHKVPGPTNLCSAAEDTQTAAATDSPSRRAVPKTVKTVVPAIEDCAYTQFYCEENVWRLCEYVRTHEAQELSKCFRGIHQQ
ncbi:hypothetical protein O3P69_016642 [Scylla paramamosain]|uniref:Uncharacterized protein n=1 Tax=Scylla paramamosain TaxID=85552 RepID=A0AAW0SYM3_SCYPA